MTEFAFRAIELLSQDQTHWIITIALILMFSAFEFARPKTKPARSFKRLGVIIVIAIIANLGAFAFKSFTYVGIVSFLLQFQIFSISKLPIPTPILFVGCILLLDLLVYAIHLMSHKITLLWKLHAIHHADEHVDAKTGLLQHPFETIFGLLCVLAFSIILGVPVIAVILYASIGTLHNVFSHSNIELPSHIERWVRLLIVTPDMHRVHHSIEMREGNSNFGQVFPFWDRIFGTYIATPSRGDQNIIVGLPEKEKPKSFSTIGLLLMPFKGLFKHRA
jgi:sterol desaturase/sphingolipid hydroxylase (fatty acid hydroxylase superfamily)